VPRVIVRRRSRSAPAALTAAAQRVDARNPVSFRSSPFAATAGTNWHDQAWYFLERVGELEYYVSWRSASASRCRIVASALDDQGAPMGMVPDEDPKAEQVRQIVNDIAGGVSGQIKIMARAAYLLTVVGECWLGMIVRDPSRESVIDGNIVPVDVRRPGFQREQWFVFGRDDIKASTDKVELKLPDGTKHEFNEDEDVLFRIWDEHPKDPSKPVSPVWANRDVLQSLVQASATITQANNSRLVGNGIMFVPQQMSLPSQNAPVAADPGELPAIPDPLFEDGNAAQSLQELLFDVASAAKKDPNSQAAQLPIIAAVPGEHIKDVKWMRAGSDIPDTTLKIEEFDIRRLATGLHVAPERLLGMSQGNHWSSWLIDESDVKVHIAPVVEIIVSALTQEVLRPKLAELGIDPNQYIVWYDASSLTQDPDKSDEARDAFDRGALTAKALREHLGFDDQDGYDLTTADGWIQLALDKIALDPANASIFMPIIEAAAQKVGLEVKAPQAALPPAEDPAGDEDDTADSEPDQPDSDPAEDTPPSQTAAAGITLARVFTNRALELANKRRRTRADAAKFRGVPIELAHTNLDPVPLADTAELIRGWDTGVSDHDIAALGLDPGAFRGLVEGAAFLALATASAPVLTQSMLRRTHVPT
jgi:hypothetical protein